MKRFWDFLRGVFGMKSNRGKGHIQHTPAPVLKSVTLTPLDVGLMAAGDTRDSIISVQEQVGTGPITSRDPKGTPIVTSFDPLVIPSFVAPNIARLTFPTPAAAVDKPFEFEADAQ